MVPRPGEKKTVKKSVYGSSSLGHFALEGDYSLAWEKCREQFAYKFGELVGGFYFCHTPDEGHRIMAFITKTEEIINFVSSHHSYEPTLFCETDCRNVMWIEPSRFWMRRQLFTILGKLRRKLRSCIVGERQIV